MTEAEKATQKFLIRAGTYEGPFELLLELIEKRQLSVSEISLAQVTDEFIEHVRGHAQFPMEVASQFIGTAATLLLIKSRSLIPELELSKDEEEDVEDLTRRLAAYERARDAARELSRIFGRTPLIEAGERAPEPHFSPTRDLTQELLVQALVNTFAAREKDRQEKIPEARVRTTISIEEVMDSLQKRVERALTLSFTEFTGDKKEKVEVIVSFLALLELVKQGAVDAAQHSTYGEIHITNSNSSAIPQY